MYINVASWNLRISEIQIRYVFKQTEINYNGRVLLIQTKMNIAKQQLNFPHR